MLSAAGDVWERRLPALAIVIGAALALFRFKAVSSFGHSASGLAGPAFYALR